MADSRDPHRAEREAEKRRRYHDAMVDLDTGNATHLTADAIAACHLCDESGYTQARRICDHQDHSTAARRGMQAIRAALTKGP